MSQQQRVKKPIWKRWWVWVIVGLLVIVMISGGNGNDEEAADEPEEQVEVVEEVEEEPEGVLSAEEVEAIKTKLVEEFEEEKEFTGDEYMLHDIEYDVDDEQLNVTVDYQVDPILSKDELISTNEAWTWGIAEAMPNISGKDFNIRITAVTNIGDDEFIHWGSTRYTYTDEQYTFREGEGMELLD